MAGGGTSWLELALYLIARAMDVETAMQVARINLIDWHDIGQPPFARLARSRQVEDATIARCQHWIADNYPTPSPVAAMVQLSGLPERSFKRRFQQATGMPPPGYVHTLRLEEASQIARAQRRVDRGHRQRGRLRERRVLRAAVPAPGRADAGAIPTPLRLHATRPAEQPAARRCGNGEFSRIIRRRRRAGCSCIARRFVAADPRRRRVPRQDPFPGICRSSRSDSEVPG